MAQKVLRLLRSTESAVRTFQRAKLWRDAPQQYKGEKEAEYRTCSNEGWSAVTLVMLLCQLSVRVVHVLVRTCTELMRFTTRSLHGLHMFSGCHAIRAFAGQIIPPQVQELLASPVVLPSPYLEQAIQVCASCWASEPRGFRTHP